MSKKSKKPNLTTFIGGVIDKLSYGEIALCILIVLFLCAAYFYFLSPFDHGTTYKHLTWYSAIYFSVITFTSLGYGDIAPIGFGKAVATFEVLSGLITVAIFVGKIASERQSVMLRLIYTSTHQRRLVELEHEVDRLNEELDLSLNEHNHEKTYFLSQSIYRFIASTGKYLKFQSSEGDLATFGNNSAFRRLYQSILNLQITIYEAIRTYGINEKSKRNFEQISIRINGIVLSMKKSHNQNDTKIESLLDEILQYKLYIENWNSELKNGNVSFKYRNELTDYILGKVKERIPKDTWVKDTHKKIAKELGISNKLAEKCIDKIFKEGIIEYNYKEKE